MYKKFQPYVSLIIWIVLLIFIGSSLGSLTKSEVNTWYQALNRSPFTPPNFVFPIAWTILYGIIGICCWIIWRASSFPRLPLIRSLYVIQLVLNWSWTPLFFRYHLSGLSLLVLIVMDALVGMLIYLSYSKLKPISILMMPYLLWILFATYLNFYIWHYN